MGIKEIIIYSKNTLNTMPLYVNDGDDGFIVYESHCDGNVDDDVNVTLVSDDGI